MPEHFGEMLLYGIANFTPDTAAKTKSQNIHFPHWRRSNLSRPFDLPILSLARCGQSHEASMGVFDLIENGLSSYVHPFHESAMTE
jgi:hypothetical protein